MAADAPSPSQHGAMLGAAAWAAQTTDLDSWLQSPGQLQMLAEAPMRLPTDCSKLAAAWRKEHSEDEKHCMFCTRHCCWGILCLGVPCCCLPYNMSQRCRTVNENTEFFSRLSGSAEVVIDSEAVTISYRSLEREEVTGSTDKSYRVPLISISDAKCGHLKEVKKFDPDEGFSWWTGYYRLHETSSGPLHIIPFSPEHSGPFPDGFTLITTAPVIMEEKCCEGETVGVDGETLFKMYRINHDIVFLANAAKSKKAILLAAQMKRSEAA